MPEYARGKTLIVTWGRQGIPVASHEFGLRGAEIEDAIVPGIWMSVPPDRGAGPAPIGSSVHAATLLELAATRPLRLLYRNGSPQLISDLAESGITATHDGSWVV